MTEPQSAKSTQQVTPLRLLGAGTLVLSVGAAAGFGSHFVGTGGEVQEASGARLGAACRTPPLPPLLCRCRCTCRHSNFFALFSLYCTPPPEGTAKQLAEEGIDPRSRLKFLPVAVKALAASTAVCAGLAVLVVGGWKLAGVQYKEIADVSSWDDALALAQQQRVRARSASGGWEHVTCAVPGAAASLLPHARRCPHASALLPLFPACACRRMRCSSCSSSS